MAEFIFLKRRFSNTIQPSLVVGVQAIDNSYTVETGLNIKQVSLVNDQLVDVTLDTTYFNNHPSFQFPDRTVNTNLFCEIPICYWWRGLIDGKFTLLLSPTPLTWNDKVFGAQKAVFLHKTLGWVDKFYYSKYRVWNDNNVPKSHANKPGWNTTWVTLYNAIKNLGTYYSMLSYQQHCEIASRVLIEKCTFNPFPKADRNLAYKCQYRGIQHFCYGYVGTSAIAIEYVDGIICTNSTAEIEYIEKAQDTVFIKSGISFGTTAGYISDFYYDNEYINYLYIGPKTSTATIIPNFFTTNSKTVYRRTRLNFNNSIDRYGMFNIEITEESTASSTYNGARMSLYNV